MPIKVVAPKLPEWADPDQASVFDPLTTQLIRRAVDIMGVKDPNQIMGMASPLEAAAPLVSIYPTKGIRAAATRRFLEAAKEFPPQLREALGSFAEGYPRIAAHMNPIAGPQTNATAAATTGIPLGKVTRPLTVNFTPKGIAEAENIANLHVGSLADEYVRHEGTHVAQALGNSNMGELYQNSSNIGGYVNNPFEMTASSVGRAAKHGSTWRKPLNAIDLLRDQAYEANKFGPTQAGRQIQQILADRYNRGWSPSGK